MISSQKCLTRSQNKALQCVSLLKVHKIKCTQLYRIVNSNRRFPDWNCSHARILMEFKVLIPLLSLKFQRLKKMLPVMKLVCIYQTHISHPSVNKGVTAVEVRHSEEVSSFISWSQGHKCMQSGFWVILWIFSHVRELLDIRFKYVCASWTVTDSYSTHIWVSDMHLTADSFVRLFGALDLSANIRK